MALITDSLTIPPAASLNTTGKSAADRQLPAAASRAVVPLVYGEDRISGLVLNVLSKAYTPGTLLVQVLWCHGCDSISAERLNDQALPAGATITHYTGSQTTVPVQLYDAFAAQGIYGVRPLTGYAWSMLEMPAALFDGNLSITATVRGRRCYDPTFDSTAGGSGAQRLADPATWAYTDIPAVCLADFLASPTYGCGVALDWASVRTAAAANRAIVPGSSEQRRLVGVSFTSANPAADVAETLRAYAGCFLLPGASGIKLLPDANDATVATYRHDDGQIAAIDVLDLRDLNQAPTAVEVIYTDRSAIPWRDASATAQLAGAGTTKPWRLSQVRLPGIQRYGQALREATERLNKLNLNNLSTMLEVFDIGIRHELGDIIEVEHPIGLSLTPMRIGGPPTMPAPGRWRLPLVRHSAAAYSDAVASAAAVQDSVRVVGSKLSDAELQAALDANKTSRPNLLPYGGFEKGLAGWSGAPISSFFASVSNGWGRFAISGTIGSGTGFIQHAPVPVSAGEWYTVHGDIVLLATAGAAYFDVQFLDSGGGTLLDGPQNPRNAPFDFSSDDATRRIVAVEAQAPTGAVSAVVRFVWSALVGCTALGARLVKLERGRLPYTAYSNEAALLQAATDASTAQSAADAANSQLADIASDSVLSPGEKPAVLLDYNTLTAEQASLDAQADTYFITTEKATYDAALAALTTYLGTLTGWNIIPGSSVAIVGSTFRAKFGDVYAARQALLARVTALTAGRLQTRRNLLPNGGFETGATGWALGSSGLTVNDGVWGRTLQRISSFSGTGSINSAQFPVVAGETYTITGDSLLFASSGQVSFDLLFYNSGGTLLLDGPNAPIAATHDFSNSDGQRTAHAVQATAPAGSAYAVARFVWESVVSGTALGCRQIKVERGGLPATPYSADAAMLAIYDAATQAIAAAATAQSTADGKIDSFYQTTPPASFSNGDIWFDTDDGNKQYVAVSGTWVLAADTRIGAAITAAAGAQATADGKVTTFYASSAPTATAVGDLWANTTAGSTRLSRWGGSAWVVLSVIGAGDVDTGQLANNAATEITQDTYAFSGASTGSGPIVQRSLTVTPPVACKVNFTATVGASQVLPDSANYLYWAVSAGGGADVTLGNCSTSNVARQTYACVASFDAAAGVSLVFKLVSDRQGTNPAIQLYDSAMRVEVIKR